MKKKILIFVQDGVGGAERMSVLIGKSLDPNIYNVCFGLIQRQSSSSIVDFIPKGMKTITVPNKNPLLLMKYIVMTIIKEKPYAVFSSVINLNNKILPFRWLYPNVKVIIRCDNYLYTYTEKQRKIIGKLYPKADCIIAQTQEMKDELVYQLNIDNHKIFTLNNPIDKHVIDIKVTAISPFPDNGKKHFVAVGRFNRQKGFDILVKAFIYLSNRRNDIDLYIIGDYTLDNCTIYKDIITLLNDGGVEDLVHCVGYKDNPYIYMKNADCFVLSSRWEGLPNALIEALYLGTPVAACKSIPIIERIINEGVNGYCVENEDSLSLAKAMNKALSLGRIESTYKSASINDFCKLFE